MRTAERMTTLNALMDGGTAERMSALNALMPDCGAST
jgi:hypothetical protein